MQGNWVLKIYTKRKLGICRKKNAKLQRNCYVLNFIDKPKKEIRQLRRAGIKYSCYKVEYERAGNYRQVFFARTKGPYRCRYCHKKLQKNQVVVDHIVPVAKVQKTNTARIALAASGCRNVNDIRNLAPACQRCNSKKSDKMGIWVIRGWLGKYRFYWILLRLFQILCIILTVIGAVYVIRLINPTDITAYLSEI